MAPASFFQNLSKGLSGRLSKLTENPRSGLGLDWFTLKYLKHLPAGKMRSHKLFGKSIYFLSPPEFLHGIDEIFVDEIYKQQLPPKAFIIDCGANIGMSILYFKRLCPTAEIVAFEPDSVNFGILEKNIQSFNLENISLRQEAVWIEKTFLNFSGEASMGSRIEAATTTNSRQVQAIRLNDYLTREIDFLKIDIEGAEYAVLKDIKPNLSKVGRMFVEYHGTFGNLDELSEIFSILVECGFKYYIKEAAPVYKHPFLKDKDSRIQYDVQLNIFCYKN